MLVRALHDEGEVEAVGVIGGARFGAWCLGQSAAEERHGGASAEDCMHESRLVSSLGGSGGRIWGGALHRAEVTPGDGDSNELPATASSSRRRLLFLLPGSQ